MVTSKNKDTHDDSFVYSKEEVINKLKEYANEYGFILGLFGSYARDEQNSKSDIDLMLFEDGKVLKEDNNKKGYYFKKRLEYEMKKDISINYWDNLKEEVMATAEIDLIKIFPTMFISSDI